MNIALAAHQFYTKHVQHRTLQPFSAIPDEVLHSLSVISGEGFKRIKTVNIQATLNTKGST
jgi:hypothetical protein